MVIDISKIQIEKGTRQQINESLQLVYTCSTDRQKTQERRAPNIRRNWRTLVGFLQVIKIVRKESINSPKKELSHGISCPCEPSTPSTSQSHMSPLFVDMLCLYRTEPNLFVLLIFFCFYISKASNRDKIHSQMKRESGEKYKQLCEKHFIQLQRRIPLQFQCLAGCFSIYRETWGWGFLAWLISNPMGPRLTQDLKFWGIICYSAIVGWFMLFYTVIVQVASL